MSMLMLLPACLAKNCEVVFVAHDLDHFFFYLMNDKRNLPRAGSMSILIHRNCLQYQ